MLIPHSLFGEGNTGLNTAGTYQKVLNSWLNRLATWREALCCLFRTLCFSKPLIDRAKRRRPVALSICLQLHRMKWNNSRTTISIKALDNSSAPLKLCSKRRKLEHRRKEPSDYSNEVTIEYYLLFNALDAPRLSLKSKSNGHGWIWPRSDGS